MLKFQKNLLKRWISNLIRIIFDTNRDGNYNDIIHTFCILIYFSQILSYIFEIYQYNYQDEKIRFLSRVFYFSNFAKILFYIDNKILLFSSFSLILALMVCFVIYLFFFTSQSPQFISSFYDFFFKIYYWTLVVPYLEIFSEIFSCETSHFRVTCNGSTGIILLFFSFMGIFLTIGLGCIYLWVCRDYTFLEKNELRFKPGFASFFCFFSRVGLALFTSFMGDNFNIIFYLLFFAFAFMNIFDYFSHFAIKPPRNSQIFISCLLAYLLGVFILSIFQKTSFLTEDDAFVLCLILSVPASRIGVKFFDLIYYKILCDNHREDYFFVFGFEEMLRLHLDYNNDKVYNKLLVSGMILSHAKKCTKSTCKFRKGKMMNFWKANQIDQSYDIRKFIMEKLYHQIENLRKKSIFHEELIFKYITFLMNFNDNFANTYYKLKKINFIYANKSFFASLFFKFFLRKLHNKIRGLENEQNLTHVSDTSKYLNTSTFLKLNTRKTNFEAKMRFLLKSRINFWEKYKEGFTSYEEITFKLNKEVSKVFSFNNIIHQKNKNENYEETLLMMKFSSICSCVLMNHMYQAIHLEEQLDKIKQRNLRTLKSGQNLSILDDNLIVCEASFLKAEGILLNSCKNEHVAAFFGYDLQELRLVKTVEQLMPAEIAKYHQSFINYSFSKKQKHTIIGRAIFTFAENKNKFLFPVKTHLGYSLQYQNDFVIHAAVIKQNEVSEAVLINRKGKVLGGTQEFFNIFKRIYPNIPHEKFNELIIFVLMPKLQKMFQEKEKWNDGISLRNREAELYFPENLEEILEAFRFKNQEMVLEEDQQNSYGKISFAQSTATIKSIKSPDVKSVASRAQLKKFLSKFTKEHEGSALNLNQQAFGEFLTERDENACLLLMKDLISKNNLKKTTIYFDLHFMAYQYGKEPEDYLASCWLQVSSKEKIKLEKTQEMNDDKKETDIFESLDGSTKLRNITENNIQESGQINPKKESEANLMENIEGSDSSHLESKIPYTNVLCFDKDQTPIAIDEIKVQNTELKKKGNPEPIITLIKKPTKNEETTLMMGVKQENEPKIELSNTTDREERKVNRRDEKDIRSGSSSVSTLKKSNTIFETIKKIQTSFPNSLICLVIFIFFEIFFIIIFGVTIYSISTGYITKYYEPLQITSMNQCRTNIGIDLSALVFGEFEYYMYNFSKISVFQHNELMRITNLTYFNARQMFYEDRNRKYDFPFGYFLQRLYIPYVDYRNPSKVTKVLLPDMTDKFLEMLHTFIDRGIYDLDIFKNFIRNFPYYALATRSLRENIQAEFVSSNLDVTQKVLSVLIIFMSIIGMIKFLELFVFYVYYSKIQKLLKIFIRVNQRDVDIEMMFLRDTLNIFTDKHQSYFKFNYAELRTDKKYDVTEENLLLANKNSLLPNQKKSKQKQSFPQMRNKSRFKAIFFLLVTLVIESSYLVGTYYFWTNTNANILKLIGINNTFNDLFTFTTTDLCNQCFLVREKIIRDTAYEASKETNQIHTTRLTYFSVRYLDRLNFLKSFITKLPSFAVTAQQVISNKTYDNLLNGDLCSVLKERNRITDEQISFCKNMFNGALNKGIFSAMNELTFYLSNQKNNCALINESNATAVNKQKASIFASLKDSLHTDVIITDFYLSECVFMIYIFLSDYHSGVLYEQINNMKVFLWSFCVVDALVMAIISYIAWKFLYHVYRYVAWSMAIIPFGKISNDEQTIFLLKNFWNNRNKIQI